MRHHAGHAAPPFIAPLPIPYPLATPTAPAGNARGAPRSLTGLVPFLKPYRARIAWSLLCLVLAALAAVPALDDLRRDPISDRINDQVNDR